MPMTYQESANMKIFIQSTGSEISREIECDTDILLRNDRIQFVI